MSIISYVRAYFVVFLSYLLFSMLVDEVARFSEGLVNFIDFFKVLVFLGPLLFVLIAIFSLFCRLGVKRYGENFVRLAINRNTKYIVFKEIVQFEDGDQ